MPLSWPSERVVVTGGAGFLGSRIVEALRARGAREIFVPRSKDYDLVDMEAVRRLYRDAKPRSSSTAPPSSAASAPTGPARGASSTTTS